MQTRNKKKKTAAVVAIVDNYIPHSGCEPTQRETAGGPLTADDLEVLQQRAIPIVQQLWHCSSGTTPMPSVDDTRLHPIIAALFRAEGRRVYGQNPARVPIDELLFHPANRGGYKAHAQMVIDNVQSGCWDKASGSETSGSGTNNASSLENEYEAVD